MITKFIIQTCVCMGRIRNIKLKAGNALCYIVQLLGMHSVVEIIRNFRLLFKILFLLEFAEDFDFVILISASKISGEDFSPYFEKTIAIPSMHIIGETDAIITKGKYTVVFIYLFYSFT